MALTRKAHKFGMVLLGVVRESWRLLPMLVLAVAVSCSDEQGVIVPPPPPPLVVEYAPSCSPDGQYIAFTLNDETNLSDPTSIWLLVTADSTIHRLDSGFFPTFSTTGATLAYTSLAGPLMRYTLADSSISVLWANGPFASASWGPADAWIVVDRVNSGASDGIYWKATVGDSSRRLLPSGHRFPAVSPNGKWVDYVRPTPGYGLSQIGLDDSTVTSITGSASDHRGVAWNHAGTALTWSRDATVPGPPGIWTMNPDGGQQTALNAQGITPTWAANDVQIVFSRFDPARNGYFLAAMNTDGSGLRFLLRPNWNSKEAIEQARH